MPFQQHQQLYREIFLRDMPLLDLRAPEEFVQGAFAHAKNLPLMSNSERSQVGTCYKQKGQQAAITLGHQLVSGEVKQTRLAQWVEFTQQHPDGYLYCFRGGLRSRTVESWLVDEGVNYPRIPGGYKAMRRFLIDETLRLIQHTPLQILSGLTGSGKTQILACFNNTIDLEALANHRGSCFGGQISAQPSQINFENNLAVAMLKLEAQQVECFLLEDEARLIGTRSLPFELHQIMQQRPLILINETLAQRVDNIFQEYVLGRFQEYVENKTLDPFAALQEYLLTAIGKIQKRLGHQRYIQLKTVIEQAMVTSQSEQDFNQHRDWIEILLKDYYDPMYRFQLAKKQQRVSFSGDKQEVLEYLAKVSQH